MYLEFVKKQGISPQLSQFVSWKFSCLKFPKLKVALEDGEMAVVVSEMQKWVTVYSAHRFWASLCKELYVRYYKGLQSK